MEDVQVAATQGLSQVERVVDTFVAPSKTFLDILRSTSWWLPFLILMVVTMASAFAIDQKIGFDRVAEQSISQSASATDQMSQLAPDARAAAVHRIAIGQKYGNYAAGVFILVFGAIVALLNWASMNFGLGAKTTFGQNFAVCMYAGLPKIFIALLNIVFVYAGVNTENFDLTNPVGTNIGYYMADSAHWLRMAGSFFDIFGLWSLALMVIGLAIISKKSKGQAAIVAVGWWLIGMFILVGFTAAKG
ncbi:MAG TPA: YIP1 family protein [Acidobacteriaceae bacterium]